MYVCFSNVNFINTMIIMKKIIYLVLLALITGLVAQFRRDQRVYSVGELLCPLCASCGACVGGCIC